jgi:hypothetical protein
MRFTCIALAIVAASACGRPADRGHASPGAVRGANVLLITIDTLRRDRVGDLQPQRSRLSADGSNGRL